MVRQNVRRFWTLFTENTWHRKDSPLNYLQKKSEMIQRKIPTNKIGADFLIISNDSELIQTCRWIAISLYTGLSKWRKELEGKKKLTLTRATIIEYLDVIDGNISTETSSTNGLKCYLLLQNSLYLRNRKHFPCFDTVVETRVEVWANEKLKWKNCFLFLL